MKDSLEIGQALETLHKWCAKPVCSGKFTLSSFEKVDSTPMKKFDGTIVSAIPAYLYVLKEDKYHCVTVGKYFSAKEKDGQGREQHFWVGLYLPLSGNNVLEAGLYIWTTDTEIKKVGKQSKLCDENIINGEHFILIDGEITTKVNEFLGKVF